MRVDFRVQPPYASFLDLHFFRPRPEVEDPVHGNSFAAGRRTPASFTERSVERMVEELDEAGVEVAVLMGQRCAPRWGNADNDDLAALLTRWPDRFVGFAGIDPTDSDAVEQIDRAVQELGCRGVHLIPGWCEPPLHLDDPAVLPLYQRCAELGVPVAVTSSHFVGPDLGYASPAHIQHVADAFPELRIVLGHGAYPWTTAACAVAMRCTNLYLMPEFYLYLPGMPGARDYIDAANTFLAPRMLYSSCYPSRSIAQALEHVAALPLQAEARRAFLEVNGARLLGLA